MTISHSPDEYRRAVSFLTAMFPYFLIYIGVCWALKRKEFGGWLLYFYGWMFLMSYLYLREFLRQLDSYLPNAQIDNHGSWHWLLP